MSMERATAGAAGFPTRVVFHELPAAHESRLWETERARHADPNRLHLRSLEAILSPTCSAESIVNSVTYGVTSQGLRVTQRDEGRVVAQRVEAPYLASFSSGGRRALPGAEREEWRVFVATLGVSRVAAAGAGVERVLRLSFITDPCPKQTALAAKGSAAVAFLRGSVASVSSGLGVSTSGGGVSGSSSTSSTQLSAVAIANLRSSQRAEALVEAIVRELDKLGCAAAPAAVPPAGMVAPEVDGSQPTAVAADREGRASDGDGDGDGARGVDFDAGAEELVLAPFEGGGADRGMPMVCPASSASSLDEGEVAGAERRAAVQREGGEAEVAGNGAGDLVAGAGAVADPTAVEVRLCLQFAEGLYARAEEYSRRDASETWRPLEETVRRLERDNEKLRALLEPKYHAVGVDPPLVPTWSDQMGFGDTDWPGLGLSEDRESGGTGGAGRRVTTLLQSTPLFAIEGAWVKARVVAASGEHDGNGEEEGGIAPPAAPAAAALPAAPSLQQSSSSSSSTATTAESPRDALLVRAVVKALAEVVDGACEARGEEFLKARIPGAQAYVEELEGYRSAIIGGKPLRAAAGCPAEAGGRVRGGQADGPGVEIDDELWLLFAVRETRLYSSSAALGKRPGRIYLTFSTLWFHSKVLGFESRHVLPLAEVRSVTLLGTALDLSSSLVISNKSGGEIMLVFPGQRTRYLEPLEVLIRELARVAEKGAGGDA